MRKNNSKETKGRRKVQAMEEGSCRNTLPPQTGLKCLHWMFSLSLVYAHMLLACTHTTLRLSIPRLGWYFSMGWK